MASSSASALAAFITLGIFWGANFLFMKVAVGILHPLQVTWLRIVFGMIPMVALAAFRGRLRREDARHFRHYLAMAVLAILIPFYCMVRATQFLPSGIAGVVAGTIPLMSALVLFLTGRGDPLGWRRISGLSLGFAGIGLLGGLIDGLFSAPGPDNGGGQLIGLGFMLLAALGYASANVYTQRFINPLKMSAVSITAYQTLIAALLLALITPFHGMSEILNHPLPLAGVVVGLGLCGTGIAFVLYYFIIEKMGVVSASAVFYLPPVVALVIGAIVRGERLSPSQWAGTGFVLIGIYLARARPKSTV